MKRTLDYDQVIRFACTCSNPYQITTRTGDHLNVPCGKCKYCQLQKSYQNKHLCDIEAQNSKYVYFATLTYNQENVPYFYLEPICSNSENLTMFQFVPLGRLSIEDPDIELDTISMNDAELQDILFKIDYHFTLSNHKLYTLYPKDLQNFFKRLRFHAAKLSDTPVRYYAVGEYGPEHYRPHWHVILYLNDPTQAENITQIVSKCWQYGFTNTSKSKGKVSNYLTSYVNSNAIIPDVYKIKGIKPRCFHSQFFGLSILKPYEEKIKESGFAFFNETYFSISGKVQKLYPSKNIRNYYFPKFPADLLLSAHEKIALLKFAPAFYRFKTINNFNQPITAEYDGLENSNYYLLDYSTTSLIKEVIDIALSDKESAYHLPNFEEFENDFALLVHCVAICYKYCNQDRVDSEEDYFIDYIKRVLSVSNRINKLYPNYTPRQLLVKFDQFYSDFEKFLINNFYENLELYSSLCENEEDFKSLLLFYNDTKSLTYETEIKNPLEQDCNIYIATTFDATIKHKKQNDINHLYYNY